MFTTEGNQPVIWPALYYCTLRNSNLPLSPPPPAQQLRVQVSPALLYSPRAMQLLAFSFLPQTSAGGVQGPFRTRHPQCAHA